MGELTLKVTTHHGTTLTDAELVQEWMDRLTERFPTIQSYQFIRTGDSEIQLFVWGEFEVV